MSYPFIVPIKVAFSDTDMAGVVHFSNFFKYMEAAEAAFFDSHGLRLIEQDKSLLTGWPRVQSSCHYCAPLRFGDTCDVYLFVKKIDRQKISYIFRFYRASDENGDQVAYGEMTTQRAVLDANNKTIQPLDIESSIIEKIKPAHPNDLTS